MQSYSVEGDAGGSDLVKAACTRRSSPTDTVMARAQASARDKGSSHSRAAPMKNSTKASRGAPARCQRIQRLSGATVQARTTSTHHQTANTMSNLGALTRGVCSTRDQSLPNRSATAHQKGRQRCCPEDAPGALCELGSGPKSSQCSRGRGQQHTGSDQCRHQKVIVARRAPLVSGTHVLPSDGWAKG